MNALYLHPVPAPCTCTLWPGGVRSASSGAPAGTEPPATMLQVILTPILKYQDTTRAGRDPCLLLFKTKLRATKSLFHPLSFCTSGFVLWNFSLQKVFFFSSPLFSCLSFATCIITSVILGVEWSGWFTSPRCVFALL